MAEDYGNARDVVSEEAAYAIEQWLSDSDAYCGKMKRQYRLDCLADQYTQIAKSLPRRGDYSRLKRVFSKAASDLEKLVTGNMDQSTQPIMPAAGTNAPRAFASRNLRAITRTALVSASTAATRVIADAQTVLLRSAENAQRRRLPFTQVSAALESNKVLLRSS